MERENGDSECELPPFSSMGKPLCSIATENSSDLKYSVTIINILSDIGRFTLNGYFQNPLVDLPFPAHHHSAFLEIRQHWIPDLQLRT